MTVVRRFLPKRDALVQAVDWGLEQSPLAAFFAGRSEAGKTVTVERALGIAAVLSCVLVRCDTVSALSLLTYERIGQEGEGGRRVAVDDPIYRMLRLRPNPEMTAATCWGMVETHMTTWGEALIGKTFVGGKVVELWPIRPDRVDVERRNGQKLYWVRDGKGVRYPNPYTSDEIIHVIRFTLDGLRGISPIGLAREAFGAGLAIDQYVSRFWAEGGILSGALTTDKELDDEAANRVERRVRRKMGRGSRRAWSIPVLEQGLKYQPIALPLKDAQFVEQQKWTLEQASRVLRVPLSLVNAATSDASLQYRTVESDNLQYLQHSIQPNLVRVEQALAADPDLYPTMQRFPEFLVDTLLRADAKSEAEVFRIALGGRAWMRPSEARARKNLPPDPELDEQPVQAVPEPKDER